MGKQKMPKRVEDQRIKVVEQVIANMERLGSDWKKSWKLVASPHNPVSGTRYIGSNRVMLAALSAAYGFDPRWCTFAQGKKMGWRLRKGSKSAVVEKWKPFPVGGDDDDGGDEAAKKPERVVYRCIGYWSVFNLSQFDGAPPFVPDRPDMDGGIADRLISTSRCPVDEGVWDDACYIPSIDSIRIPKREFFDSIDEFEGTLLHEMVHSTGLPLGRRKDATPRRFASIPYAREELVAELGSMFAAAELGVSGDEPSSGERYENHVAYLKCWLAALKDDPDELYHAASDASAAADYIVDRFKGEPSPSAS